MRVSAGQYLYLEAWGTPRRETPLEAVRRVLSEEIGGLTLETITALSVDRLQREMEKGRVSACLQTLGATFDPENGTWVLSADEADQADEEDFAVERPADNGHAGNRMPKHGPEPSILTRGHLIVSDLTLISHRWDG